ncbi:hypothetical protein NDU88_007263 [Pleurodeles waltl]|uniref:Uncharacterized protein n=1 Tax=Pleurodeles waltl TaxID=8319 RepID=A0AAV7QKA6_PLEWA|nr:hypothetical protein NDU88_007263 [Pleurodeles waltl]
MNRLAGGRTPRGGNQESCVRCELVRVRHFTLLWEQPHLTWCVCCSSTPPGRRDESWTDGVARKYCRGIFFSAWHPGGTTQSTHTPVFFSLVPQGHWQKSVSDTLRFFNGKESPGRSREAPSSPSATGTGGKALSGCLGSRCRAISMRYTERGKALSGCRLLNKDAPPALLPCREK